MPSAGTLWINIAARTDKLTKGLRSARAQLNKWGPSLRIAAAAGAGVIAASIKVASDAAESVNRFNAVFGDQAKRTKAFADDIARSIGRSRTDILDSLSSFQSFFVGLGFGGEYAALFSKRLQALSIDFASFNNLSDQEAVSRFISALSGSSEVLDKFGINIKQAALQEELLREGVKEAWSEITEQQKAVARLNIIMRAMTEQGAVGDAAKTAGSFANRLKALQSSVKDLSVDIGNVFLPIATKVVATFADAVNRAKDWQNANSSLTSGLGVLGDVLHTIHMGFVKVQSIIAGVFAFVVRNVNEAVSKAIDAVNYLPGVDVKKPELLGTLAQELQRTSDELDAKFQDLFVGKTPSENIGKFFAELEREAAQSADTIEGLFENAVLPKEARKFFEKVGEGVAAAAGIVTKAAGAGFSAAARLGRGGDGLPPALTLTQAGTAESYRQRVAISRQDETAKIAKQHFDEAKKQTNLLDLINRGLAAATPSNIFG